MVKIGEIEARKAERDCFCRGCDKKILKNTEPIIYTYSHRNRGQNIIICHDCLIDCVEAMSKFNIMEEYA